MKHHIIWGVLGYPPKTILMSGPALGAVKNLVHKVCLVCSSDMGLAWRSLAIRITSEHQKSFSHLCVTFCSLSQPARHDSDSYFHCTHPSRGVCQSAIWSAAINCFVLSFPHFWILLVGSFTGLLQVFHLRALWGHSKSSPLAFNLIFSSDLKAECGFSATTPSSTKLN